MNAKVTTHTFSLPCTEFMPIFQIIHNNLRPYCTLHSEVPAVEYLLPQEFKPIWVLACHVVYFCWHSCTGFYCGPWFLHKYTTRTAVTAVTTDLPRAWPASDWPLQSRWRQLLLLNLTAWERWWLDCWAPWVLQLWFDTCQSARGI
jgi:hypothetical protein